MKRQFHSSSSPSLLLTDLQHPTESEPIPKRPRIFISSPTPPPDDDDDDQSMDDNEDEEIIIDEPLVHTLTTTVNSQHEYISDDDDDDDIIEIEHETSDLSADETDNAVIIVSDSDSDDNSDDQGIDVTDDTFPLVTSIINTSISSPDTADIEIIQDATEEELSLIDDLEEQEEDDDDQESLAIVNNDNELIDLTDDEPTSFSCSSNLSERKLSTDVQQCPICLETLSHLQRTGVYLIITRCRHVMCTLCSRQLLATSSRCPLCRENVSSTTLMPYCILT